ncbi:hypothetical protein ACFP3V_18235 [Streptacidiphilus monticola]|uniref:DUF3224 domain-containing protein n=2 Tax=Streptacidiphilus monticola TaxID=2161674 RepID=A0ABW1G3Y6_9ACTN
MSKKTWALTALAATALAGVTSAAPSPKARPPFHSLRLDFSGDPEGFGGIGVVTSGRPASQVGMVYDLCNKESAGLRTDLLFCSGVIRFVRGSRGSIAFESAAPRPGLAAHYPIHFEGAVTGGTGRFKGLKGQLDFTQTGPNRYDVTYS